MTSSGFFVLYLLCPNLGYRFYCDIFQKYQYISVIILFLMEFIKYILQHRWIEYNKKVVNDMYEDLFPARLAQLRSQKKVSARDMSLSIGQNPGYVNNIETGKALPSMTGFFYICEYLGVTPQEFFDTGSRQPAELRPFVEKVKKLSRTQFASIETVVDEFLRM